MSRQALADLASSAPGRFGMAWRTALLCALVCAAAMLYRVPEAALSCYLIIFLMKPDAAECVGKGVGLIVLATVVVVLLIPLLNVTIETPILRMLAIMLVSYAFLWLGSASQLGEIGAIIALVIAFILTLAGDVPAEFVANRGLLDAWKLAALPMALMIVFCLAFGIPPQDLVRDTLAARLTAAADALERRDGGLAALDDRLREGNDAALQQMQETRLMHLAPTARTTWLLGAVETTYRLMLAAAALPDDVPAARRAALAAACRAAAEAVAAGRIPESPAAPEGLSAGPEAGAWDALAGLGGPDGGGAVVIRKKPFLAPDAFTNPEYQRFAVKTTMAAVICYVIYTGLNWQGIHTAMVTCYVAALGTTGETVHKLALRIGGCLVGALLGFAAILFVIPHMTSVGGLMLLVFAGVLPAAWVAAGPERISYAGVQIGLAFLLTILNGFAPNLDMTSGRDRIFGILLGNFVVYLVFTQFEPRSALTEARERIVSAATTLAGLALRSPAERRAETALFSDAEEDLAVADNELFLAPFDPAYRRHGSAGIARLARFRDETRALGRSLAFAPEAPATGRDRLAAIADELRAPLVPPSRAS